MMSGLRSQREYTITCVSLRSGMASSGMCRIDQTPAATPTATNRKIANLFRAENSMTRLIIALLLVLAGLGSVGGRHRLLELALRIHEKISRCDDSFAGL